MNEQQQKDYNDANKQLRTLNYLIEMHNKAIEPHLNDLRRLNERRAYVIGIIKSIDDINN